MEHGDCEMVVGEALVYGQGDVIFGFQGVGHGLEKFMEAMCKPFKNRWGKAPEIHRYGHIGVEMGLEDAIAIQLSILKLEFGVFDHSF